MSILSSSALTLSVAVDAGFADGLFDEQPRHITAGTVIGGIFVEFGLISFDKFFYRGTDPFFVLPLWQLPGNIWRPAPTGWRR